MVKRFKETSQSIAIQNNFIVFTILITKVKSGRDLKIMILPDIKIRDLERILSEIEKQKSFRFLGYILIPFIIGFFIINKANRNILKYTKKINENFYIIINELKNSNETIKNELSKIIIADKYLTYSVKTTLSDKLNKQLKIIHTIQKKIKILKNS